MAFCGSDFDMLGLKVVEVELMRKFFNIGELPGMGSRKNTQRKKKLFSFLIYS